MGPEQALGLGLGVLAGPSCRAASALHCHRALPWAWGQFHCPVTPHQPRPHGAALGAPGPRCPRPALPMRGPGTGNGTGRSPCSCTQHPVPMAARGARACCGSGGQPGIRASGREEVGPAAAMSGSFLPDMLHPARTPLPCRLPHWGQHRPGPPTPDRQHRCSRPAPSPSVPKHPRTEGQRPAPLRSAGREPEVPARTGSRRQGLLK